MVYHVLVSADGISFETELCASCLTEHKNHFKVHVYGDSRRATPKCLTCGREAVPIDEALGYSMRTRQG